MGILSSFRKPATSDSSLSSTEKATKGSTDPASPHDRRTSSQAYIDTPFPLVTWRVIVLGTLVSMGGLIFGYDTGQISGFLEMKDFLKRFGELGPDPKNPGGPPTYQFSNVRSGLIVAMLSIGTLVGALIAAPFANLRAVGRKYSISGWCIVFCIGMVVQISAVDKWYQVMAGRLVAGLGVGALSILVPLFQSESAPSHVRGAIVCCYQLFITLGILFANIVNYGTERIYNTSSWRIPMGIGYLWAIILGTGILFLPETPKHNFRLGKVEEAEDTMTKMLGVVPNHRKVHVELRQMKEAIEAERAGGAPAFYEVFTGPRMLYRTTLGIVLQAFQQLTGANFFFYYGTTIFVSTGLNNSFETQIILGTVNVVCTFPGLYFVERFGRRNSLMAGGAWMCGCFLIFASIGHFALDQTTPTNTPKAGTAMIVFACLFIAAFASTWGPMIWTVTSELFPSRYRAQAMSLTTASNWTWNFLIAFFTPFITSAIDFRYGYVFASCCAAATVIVFFFLLEAQGKTLEEVDAMYLLKVKPWESKDYKPDIGILQDRDETL
ncbi:uncharacterized protein KY384_006796 [Bacidia gigantensis]|uniref:uncharacterized protein n=1 Tax=Bacidia gigantensis TaxID=2732470 RepID=UPI001D04745C|nr:uncharacterized protein KY384_006796 [Bacidia gigantensis]KAG8527880.1 hypothetical protein KY384_006796 [Bacidia gigantensis]